MAYVLGSLFFTSSAQPNTVYIGPSNFSSAPDNYQLAFACYDVLSGSGGVQIRTIIGNQTTQQFLPGMMPNMSSLVICMCIPLRVWLCEHRRCLHKCWGIVYWNCCSIYRYNSVVIWPASMIMSD